MKRAIAPVEEMMVADRSGIAGVDRRVRVLLTIVLRRRGSRVNVSQTAEVTSLKAAVLHSLVGPVGFWTARRDCLGPTGWALAPEYLDTGPAGSAPHDVRAPRAGRLSRTDLPAPDGRGEHSDRPTSPLTDCQWGIIQGCHRTPALHIVGMSPNGRRAAPSSRLPHDRTGLPWSRSSR